VMGGADTVHDDYKAFRALWRGSVGIVACNDAIAEFPHIVAGVTLHPENLTTWVNHRESKGYWKAPMYTHKVTRRFNYPEAILTDYNFPGQGESLTSGIMAAKVAMIDLGYDRVVFCGVPMTDTPHFIARPDAPTWDIADHYFKRLKQMLRPEYFACMRSMSGRTRELMGAPDEEFCRG
jgi:hypothetical protein